MHREWHWLSILFKKDEEIYLFDGFWGAQFTCGVLTQKGSLCLNIFCHAVTHWLWVHMQKFLSHSQRRKRLTFHINPRSLFLESQFHHWYLYLFKAFFRKVKYWGVVSLVERCTIKAQSQSHSWIRGCVVFENNWLHLLLKSHKYIPYWSLRVENSNQKVIRFGNEKTKY